MFLLHRTLQNQQLNLIRLSNSYGTGTDSGNSALNYGHKFPRHGTAEGGDDFIGQSRVTQLIKQGRSLQLLGEQHRRGQEAGRGTEGGCASCFICSDAWPC